MSPFFPFFAPREDESYMNKTIIPWLLVALMLTGCTIQIQPAQTSDVTTTPSQNVTTVPTQPDTNPSEELTVPTETEPEPEPSIYQMGDLYITTEKNLSDEYTQAQVRVEYPGFDLDTQSVRIKFRGNLTKTAEKKSYNIKFGEKVSLFGMDASKKWCLLADPFDKSLLRPTIGFDYAQALGIQYTSQTKLCRLWLDGKYMGIYTAVEPVGEGKTKVDIDLETGDFLFERNYNSARVEEDVIYFRTGYGLRYELNEPEDATDEQLKQIVATLTKIEKAIQTLDHEQYEQYVNIESFVDFYIFQEVIKDVDFGHYSTRYYVKNGVLYAGPPWDLDMSMGNISESHDEKTYHQYNNANGYGNGSEDSTQGLWCNEKDFYRWLCQDEYFMELVRLRWEEVKPITENLVKDNELGQSRIDYYIQQIGDALESNYTEAGWSLTSRGSVLEYDTPAKDYLGNVDLLRQWLIKRIDWLDSQWAA